MNGSGYIASHAMINITAFWDMSFCSLVDRYQCLGEIYFLNILSWGQRQKVPPNCWDSSPFRRQILQNDMIREGWITKDLEGSDHGRDLVGLTSDRIVGFRAKIWTRRQPYMKQECYLFNNVRWQTMVIMHLNTDLRKSVHYYFTNFIWSLLGFGKYG